MKKWLFVALLLGGGIYFYNSTFNVKKQPPGVLVLEEPIQSPVREAQSWKKNGYEITPLATFNIRARLIHKEHYFLDRESDLSPIDYMLGWGPMSDSKNLDQLDISQSGRWSSWETPKMPMARREIETHSANMHMIPANKDVEKNLKSARVGDIVNLSGSLVAVRGTDGWKWRSSLSRGDTGGGSCEVVWVESIRIEE